MLSHAFVYEMHVCRIPNFEDAETYPDDGPTAGEVSDGIQCDDEDP